MQGQTEMNVFVDIMCVTTGLDLLPIQWLSSEYLNNIQLLSSDYIYYLRSNSP